MMMASFFPTFICPDHAISLFASTSLVYVPGPKLRQKTPVCVSTIHMIVLMRAMFRRHLPPVHVSEDAIGRSRSIYSEHVEQGPMIHTGICVSGNMQADAACVAVVRSGLATCLAPEKSATHRLRDDRRDPTRAERSCVGANSRMRLVPELSVRLTDVCSPSLALSRDMNSTSSFTYTFGSGDSATQVYSHRSIQSDCLISIFTPRRSTQSFGTHPDPDRRPLSWPAASHLPSLVDATRAIHNRP